MDWGSCKEIMFDFKKGMDQCYRNIMWHFTHTPDCPKCKYWDNVYLQHLAKADDPSNSTEVTDAEMLSLAETMEVDGSN